MGPRLLLACLAYNAALFAAWPVLFFFYFCKSRTDGKYRRNFRARMGFELPVAAARGSRRVWFHALSLGEVLSAVPLLREVRKMCPGLEIVFSCATETGMSFARERVSPLVDFLFYMPHDFAWVAPKLIRRVSPSLFVLIETDYWLNLLVRLRASSTPCVLVNGRMSPASFNRYSRLGAFTKMLFRQFDLVLAQTELDRERFVSLGVQPEKSLAAGNLKLHTSVDRISPAEIRLLRAELGILPERFVWVAGSTHQGEEEILLRVHRRLETKGAAPLLVIAPRNVNRRNEIEGLLKNQGRTYGMRSRGEGARDKSILLLDTLGELAKTYAVCNVAFLGGSLAPLGGHNPLEVIAQGRPACWGPHFYNFNEIETLLLDGGCGARVGSEQELADFVSKMLTNPAENARMSESAEKFAGFQEKTAEKIASILAGQIK